MGNAATRTIRFAREARCRAALWLGAGASLLAGGGGCVERTVSVQTDPPGALVYLNDQEIGRTPVTKDFTWYGTYDVGLRKDGFQTVKAKQRVFAPWYEIVPLDLFAEVLPFHFKDNHVLRYDLEPGAAEPGHAGELVDRARLLEGDLESGLNTGKKPAGKGKSKPSGASTRPTPAATGAK